MPLLQVTVQGIPGTRSDLQYPFESGLNQWKSTGSVRLEGMIDLLQTLLYPAQPWSGPLGPLGARQAALSFASRDATYRVTRDFGTRSLSLSQLEPGSTERYRDVSKDPREIEATFNRVLKLPPRRIFSELLVARPGLAGINFKADDSGSNSPVSGSNAELQVTLAGLREEKERLATVARCECEIDELQANLFAVEDQLHRLVEPKENVAELDKQYAPYVVFDQPGLVTAEMVERLKVFSTLSARRDADLQAAEEKETDWTGQMVGLVEGPIWKEAIPLMGIGCALAGFIGATIHRPWLWLFLILVLLGLAIFVYGFLRWHRRQEQISEIQKKSRGLSGERAGIEKRFEIETGKVRSFCEAVGTTDVEDILEMLKRRDELLRARKKAEAKLEAVRNEVPEEKLKNDVADLRKNIAILEQKLSELPAISVDPNALERQIQELEARLASDGAPAKVIPSSQPVSDLDGILALGAEYLNCTTIDLFRRIETGLAANIAAMTGKKIIGVETSEGRIGALRRADHSIVPFSSLDRSIQSAVRFAVMFTVWQLLTTTGAPLFVLDLLAGECPSKLVQLCLAAGGHLAKRTQVFALVS